MPRAAQASARTPVAIGVAPHGELRVAGRSRRRRSRRPRGRRPRAGRRSSRAPTPSGASRSNAARSQAIGPAGPVNGASARAADERAAESAGRPGDRDAHQSVGGPRSRRPRRRSYWRAYQPSQSPERAARHHASLARYQSTVAARPSSNAGRGRPAERGELRAVHRVAPVVAGTILDLRDERPRLAEQRRGGASTSSRFVRLGRARRRCRSRRSRRGAGRGRSPAA